MQLAAQWPECLQQKRMPSESACPPRGHPGPGRLLPLLQHTTAADGVVHLLQGHTYTSTSISLHCSAPATEPAAFWLLAVGRHSGLLPSSSCELVYSMDPSWHVQFCRVQFDVPHFGMGVSITGHNGWVGRHVAGRSEDLGRPGYLPRCRPSGASLSRWLLAQMHVGAAQDTSAGCTWGCTCGRVCRAEGGGGLAQPCGAGPGGRAVALETGMPWPWTSYIHGGCYFEQAAIQLAAIFPGGPGAELGF